MINLGLQLLRDYTVLIFSPNLKAAFQDRFPGVVFDDQEQLFQHAEDAAGTGRPEVAIFHHGGATFPVVNPPAHQGDNIIDH